ncbi:MAG: hypothetical protein R3F59_18475 [Myxococcota bacterium]
MTNAVLLFLAQLLQGAGVPASIVEANLGVHARTNGLDLPHPDAPKVVSDESITISNGF